MPLSTQNAELDTQDTPCAPCVHAATGAGWGDIGRNRTHCQKCHRSWASLREIHCVTCCEHFKNPAAIDAHLAVAGCRPPASILRKDGEPKFETTDRGNGKVWKLKFYGTRPDFVK